MSPVVFLPETFTAMATDSMGATAPVPAAPPPAYVVVTHATVQAAGRLRFALASFRLVRRMAATPGLIRQRQGIRRFGAEVWTATAWRDEASMLSFVGGTAHRAAVDDAAQAIVTMTVWHLACQPGCMPARFEDVVRLHAGELPTGCRLRDAAARALSGAR